MTTPDFGAAASWALLGRLRAGDEGIRLLQLRFDRGALARRRRRKLRAQLVPFLCAVPTSMDFGGVQTSTHDDDPPSGIVTASNFFDDDFLDPEDFFEPEQFKSVRNHLPVHMQPIVEFANVTGWRTPSEILPLEWRRVDLKAGEVRLDAGTTKNGDVRVFPFTSELRRVLEDQQ